MGKYIDQKQLVTMVAASLVTGLVIVAISKIPAKVPGSEVVKGAAAAAK